MEVGGVSRPRLGEHVKPSRIVIDILTLIVSIIEGTNFFTDFKFRIQFAVGVAVSCKFSGTPRKKTHNQVEALN